MAKAKKSESPEKESKPAAPKKAAKSKSAPAAPAGTPMVNTSFAAENAAKMLVSGHKTATGGSPIQGGPKSESALFKQLKSNLAKPHAAGLDSLLDKSAPASAKKSNLPFSGPGGGKQVGHNQTFGADVNRTGVPRRTGG